MAISLRASGSWAAANATTQTVTLPTHAAGDMLIVRVAFKHATMPTTVTCGTSGWTKIGQYNNGTTVSGNGTGSVIVAVFYKEAASASETNPVITYHASVAATPSAAVALSYQKGADEGWVAPVGAGGPVGTGTAISSTITSHISTTAGDMVDFFLSQGDNNTLTVPTFTQTGLTLGTVSEQPAAALSDATSNDIDADGGYRLVSSGTSSAAAVVTATAAAGDQGSAWTTRLRVAKAITLGLLDASRALYAPTVIPDQLLTLPLLDNTVGDDTWTTTHLEDHFSRADDASGWGDAPTGGTWGLAAGGSLTPTVLSNKGRMALAFYSDSGTMRQVSLSVADIEITGSVAYTRPTGIGQVTTPGVALRGGNIHSEIQIFDNGSASLAIAGPGISFGGTTNYITGLSATSGLIHFRFRAIGTAIDIKWWKNGDPEPSYTSVTTTYTTAGYTGFVGWWDSGDTGPMYLDWDDLLGTSERTPGAGGRVLYAPTIAGAASSQTLTLGLLDGGAALYAPTVAATAAQITLGLLDGGAALYAPTVLPQPVGITLDLLDATAALYAPTVTPKNTLTLTLLDAGAALYAPTVIIDQFVTLGLLDASAALYAPSLLTKTTLTLGLLDAGAALYAPSLLPKNTITLGLLDTGPALYAPTVISDQFVTLPLLDAAPDLYAPSLAQFGGTQSISLGLLDGANALYAPVIAAGPVGITLSLLDAGPALYAPTLIQDQFVTLGLLDAGAALYAPTVAEAGASIDDVTLAATSTFSASQAKAAAYAQTLAATSSMSASAGKVVGKRLLAAQGFVGVAPKTVRKTVAASSTFSASQTRIVPRFITLAVSSTFAASVADALVFMRTFAVSSTMSPSMARAAAYRQTLAVASTMTPAVTRRVGIVLAVGSSLSASSVRRIAKTMVVQEQLAPTMTDQMIVHLTIAASSAIAASEEHHSVATPAAKDTYHNVVLVQKRK